MTQKQLHLEFTYNRDTGVFKRIIPWKIKKYGESLKTTHHSGYIYMQIAGKKYAGHRLAWLSVYGHFPDGQIDHIDGNRSNNALSNLRVVSNQVNQQNSSLRIDNSSGQVGVSWFKTRLTWRAVINVSGKQTTLGYFKILEEAIAARKKAETHYGFHANHGKD
jgi:hypothetical protein